MWYLYTRSDASRLTILWMQNSFWGLVTVFLMISLSACNNRSPSNEETQTNTPQSIATLEITPADSTTSEADQTNSPSAARTVEEAIEAFKTNDLSVFQERKESLNQDWFPGTIGVISFKACNSCDSSFIMDFDNTQNAENAFETYSITDNFHSFINSQNRLVLIMAKDINTGTARQYAISIEAK